MNYQIIPYNDNYKNQLIAVWEKSVRATHHFLIPADIDYFKSIVQTIDFNSFSVFCLVENEKLLGFIGLADRKIEMLFLSPAYIGKSLGKMLMTFVLNEHHANEVEVNEQNTHAVKFYEKMGFTIYDRMEKDSEGKNYPILKMRR
jgi:putative acetyltransferase